MKLHYRDTLIKQRDAQETSEEEIQMLVNAAVSGELSDYQVASYMMSIYLRGMTGSETVALSKAMAYSGAPLQWGDLDGPVLGKHSTGGVGDMSSIVLAPMLAACGAYAPMISARELGHTGGTLDKLETISGYEVSPSTEKLQKVVKEVGCAIVGHIEEMNPAESLFSKVRNDIAAVDSEELIVSSIISKKLSAGINNLVLDVKAGSGAFMQTYNEAKRLATKLTNVGAACGMKIVACITDMNQPITSSIGNGLELREAIDFLKGERCNPRFSEVISKLGSEALCLGNVASDVMKAEMMLMDTIASGKAAEKFAKMVAALGGPTDLLENTDKYLPAAPVVKPVYADKRGHVHVIDMRVYARVLKELGGTTFSNTDVDHSVGISNIASVSHEVSSDKPLAVIHARNEEEWNLAADRIKKAASVEISPVGTSQAVLDTVKPKVDAAAV